jgi:hypothetical protein
MPAMRALLDPAALFTGHMNLNCAVVRGSGISNRLRASDG